MQTNKGLVNPTVMGITLIVPESNVHLRHSHGMAIFVSFCNILSALDQGCRGVPLPEAQTLPRDYVDREDSVVRTPLPVDDVFELRT